MAADGTRITDPEVLGRCEALVIPPAWTDVWICPWPNGHLQAIGTDEAGRRQYRYHDQWRRDRDEAKHERVLAVAERLPAARRQVAQDLARDGVPRERVLAAAFRLLDQGMFRVGGETYAEENGSYGLATLRREHVIVGAQGIRFDYVAKSGKQRRLVLDDPGVAEVLTALKRRRDDNPELLAFRDTDGTWRDVTSAEVNAYVKEAVGGEMTAKDFRTWHATVMAAVSIAQAGRPSSPTGRKRAVAQVMREVSDYLGNTPAVARASYVDHRVVDLWEDDVTIAAVLESLGADARPESEPWTRAAATREAIERAVLDLLTLPPAKAKAVLEDRGRRRGRRGLAAA